MSYQAIQHVFDTAADHGPHVRAVALALADSANKWGTNAFPSRALLQRKSQVSRRAVGTALERLQQEGLIERQGYRSGGGVVVWCFPKMTAPQADGGRAPDA